MFTYQDHHPRLPDDGDDGDAAIAEANSESSAHQNARARANGHADSHADSAP